ncbi:MAG: PAS domain S-box protein [Chloroflexi bacterium]|nr:PAS domain S-box protein [Chloroflexota bacterium]
MSSLISASIERADMVLRLQAHSEDLAHEVARQTAALKSERDRTIAVLENAGESILLLDQDGQIVYVNKALEDQSGFSREEVLGYTPAFLVGEEAFKKRMANFGRGSHEVKCGRASLSINDEMALIMMWL